MIDEKFCEITQKRIAAAMGKVASIQDSSNTTTEILNDLADIRSFFHWRELRAYSNKLVNSIDMNRFVNPGKPLYK